MIGEKREKEKSPSATVLQAAARDLLERGMSADEILAAVREIF